MNARDSQTRIAILADSLRSEMNMTIDQLAESARRLAPPASSEALLHLEWFTRFCLETRLAPSILAIATAICRLESTQPDPLSEESRTIEALRALVARVQTRPLLEMDSEFELYMIEKHKSLFPGEGALPSGDLGREQLARRRFDDVISQIDAVDD